MLDSGHAIGAPAQEEPWQAPHRAEEFRILQTNSLAVQNTSYPKTGTDLIPGSASPLPLKGVDRELRKSEDATHFATDGPAPRR